MGYPSAPSAPNPAASYAKEIQTTLQYAPQLIGAEDAFRGTEDPARVLQQLQLQGTFGPTQYAQQLAAQKQLDPYGVQVRNQTGQAISNDLASGYSLPPELANQLNTQIRGQTEARGGSLLGNAPISAEELFQGQAGINLHQQHLDNAGQFLGLSTPEQQISAITPVTPDRSSSYVNPNAGFLGQQLAQTNFGNQVAAYNAQGSPWARALQGGVQGYAAGGGGWTGTALGAAGAAAGYYSSRRVKENIIEIGRSASGLPVVIFNYIWDKTRRFIGTIAEDVLLVNPRAVSLQKGILCVNYNLIDAPFYELTEVV